MCILPSDDDVVGECIAEPIGDFTERDELVDLSESGEETVVSRTCT